MLKLIFTIAAVAAIIVIANSIGSAIPRARRARIVRERIARLRWEERI